MRVPNEVIGMSSDKLILRPSHKRQFEYYASMCGRVVVHTSVSTHRRQFRASFGSVVICVEREDVAFLNDIGVGETQKKFAKASEWKDDWILPRW